MAYLSALVTMMLGLIETLFAPDQGFLTSMPHVSLGDLMNR